MTLLEEIRTWWRSSGEALQQTMEAPTQKEQPEEQDFEFDMKEELDDPNDAECSPGLNQAHKKAIIDIANVIAMVENDEIVSLKCPYDRSYLFCIASMDYKDSWIEFTGNRFVHLNTYQPMYGYPGETRKKPRHKFTVFTWIPPIEQARLFEAGSEMVCEGQKKSEFEITLDNVTCDQFQQLGEAFLRRITKFKLERDTTKLDSIVNPAKLYA